MSLKYKWMAIQGSRDLLLDYLGFEPMGETSNEMGANYACRELPGGWVVFVAPGYNYRIEDAVKHLPPEPLVLVGEAFESVMFSSLRAYRGNGQLWSVVHDPDKTPRGVVVEGDPPSPFADIKRELEAEQADDEDDDVDHIFDLPTKLGKSLCGYPAAVAGAWTVLGAKGRKAEPGRRSITEAMRSELVPYLQSLGWEAPKNPADLSSPDNIVRHVDGQIQTICFEFMSGSKTYIEVIFETQGKRPSGLSHPVRGVIQSDFIPQRPGAWQGFFKPRLPAPDPVDEAIKSAKADILVAEEFLKTDEVKPNIRLYRGLDPEAVEEDD
jgi:hypothetical protein